jgi:hypothetical protein
MRIGTRVALFAASMTVDVSNMTTYPVDELWEQSKAYGFVPHGLYLMPTQPLVSEERYV